MSKIKILTYNIQQHILKKNKSLAKVIVQKLNAEPFYDIVCFQEVFDESIRKILKKGLKRNYPHRRPKSGIEIPEWIPFFGWFDEDSGLFFASRHPIKKRSKKKLRHFEQFSDPGRETADFIAKKGIFFALLDIDGKDFFIFNTHLQSGNHPNVRKNQLKHIQAYINRKTIYFSELKNNDEGPENIGNFNVVLVGDFNVDEHFRKSEYDEMIAQLLYEPRDLYRELWTNRKTHPGYTCDGEDNSHLRSDIKKRVDYIFAFNTITIRDNIRSFDNKSQIKINPIEIENVDIVKFKDMDKDVSDHFGVEAEINI